DGQAEGGDGFGSSLTTGDFNADGFADLAMGSPGESVGVVSGAGQVDVLYGGPRGLGGSGHQAWAQDSPGILDQGEADDAFGSSLGAGDFNGDGFGDLAVGVPLEDVGAVSDAGAVNVLFGSPLGLESTGNQFWTQDSTDVLDSAEPGDGFGTDVAVANFDG